MGVAAFVFILALINPIQGKKKKIPEEDLIKVVVAKEKIEHQTKITDNMVEVKKIHKEAVPEDPVTTEEEVVGKVAMVTMFSGDVFIPEKLAKVGSDSAGLGVVVPDGMRAITMNVEQDTGVSGLIKVGNKVDVISVIDNDQIHERAILLLQNREVLALDKVTSSTSDKQDSDNNYLTITLSVTPKEALKLSLSQTVGERNCVVLRNQEDLQLLKINNVKLKDLME